LIGKTEQMARLVAHRATTALRFTVAVLFDLWFQKGVSRGLTPGPKQFGLVTARASSSLSHATD